jgi:short chain dehydrogenase
MLGGNKRYSMHSFPKSRCKKLQKGLDFCLEQTVTAPVPVQRQRLFRDSSPAGYSACGGFSGDGGSRQCLSKNVTEQDYRHPLEGRALSLGRVGARNLAKSPRFSEPIGKKGVHKDGQHSIAAAIFITGASRGLGFEFASQYAADGWRVFAACRSPAAATKLQRLAQDTEGMLKIVAMDVTDAECVREAATQLEDVAIDVLINSAGITGASGQK